MVPDAHLQYFFGKEAILMNYKNDGMKDVIPPTDTRWRKDLDFYERGQEEDSEKAKVDIELE